MPPPPPLLYQPRRITEAKSVLIPISPLEVERLARSHHNPLRKTHPPPEQLSISSSQPDGAWSPSRVTEEQLPDVPPRNNNTRGTKRRASPAPFDQPHPTKAPRHSVSDALVAQHYNARPEVGKTAREASPIIGLKNFNNWIKAVLIAKFARPAIHETNSRTEGLEFVGARRRPKYTARILDLGCGKGGDLGKWAKAEIAGYVGVDIADVSIDQARGRYMEGRRKPYDAEFFALDCFSVRILSLSYSPSCL